jgi:hypothetical protein
MPVKRKQRRQGDIYAQVLVHPGADLNIETERRSMRKICAAKMRLKRNTPQQRHSNATAMPQQRHSGATESIDPPRRQ